MESLDNFNADMITALQTAVFKGQEVWIADTARVFGRVTLGDHCSVWFGAVIRGDRDTIDIEARTNIQENAVVHVDPGYPVHIGQDCVIGHGAIVHGATIGNNVLVGMQATVLNGATIGNDCIIGAHALIPEGMHVPEGSLVMGMPGKVVRQLTDEQKEKIRKNADTYVRLSRVYLKYYR